MGKRTRVPGPITVDQSLGNSGERHNDGLSRWISVDVNDGWTLYDPNSSVVSVTTSTDGMRIVSDNAQNSLRWNATNQQTGRWHKKLVGPDGQDLTFGDFFTVEILIKLVTLHANTGTSGSDRSGIYFGIVDSDVTDSTSACNWVGQGALLKYISDPGLQSVVGGDTGTTNAQDSDCVSIYATIGPPVDDDDVDDNPSTRHLTTLMLDNNNHVVESSRPSSQTFEYTVTDSVYLFLSPSWGSTVGGIDDADATWKVWYRINLARDGLAPTYIPKSGISG